MKNMWLLIVCAAFLFLFVGMSQAKQTAAKSGDCVCQFIDEDGDGICDLCDGCIPQGEDDDGDGIPNGQDDDYVAPQDGSGAQKGR